MVSTPYQVGMTVSCNSFRLIVTDDQCGSIGHRSGCESRWFLSLEFCRWIIMQLVVDRQLCVVYASYVVSCFDNFPRKWRFHPNAHAARHDDKLRYRHLVQVSNQCGTVAASAEISLVELYVCNPTVSTARCPNDGQFGHFADAVLRLEDKV